MSSSDETMRCAFCGRRSVEPEWRPFCSKRCKLQDLARWADGTYRVAGEHTDDGEHANDYGPANPGTTKQRISDRQT